MTQASNAVGSATVTFTSCTSAQLAFNFTGGGNARRAGMIALSRVGPVPAGLRGQRRRTLTMRLQASVGPM